MAQIIPPIPYDKPQTSFEWIDWYTKLLSVINSGTFPHNGLTGLQGGGGGDFYHLSATDYANFVAITSNLNETIDDRVDALIQDGTGITWSYNDGANTLTPTVSLSSFSTTNLSEGTNLYFTDERVDDRVNSLLVAGSNITLTYNDVANTLTIASTGGSGGGSIDDALALSIWL